MKPGGGRGADLVGAHPAAEAMSFLRRKPRDSRVPAATSGKAAQAYSRPAHATGTPLTSGPAASTPEEPGRAVAATGTAP